MRDASSADLALLGLLQLADTSFPSGAYTLSHGLETLVADGLVHDSDELAEVIEVSLLSRLARADLPAILWSHDAAQALGAGDTAACARLVTVDRHLRAAKLAREEREGSERVGRRLVVEAAALAPSPALASYETAIRAGEAPGNSAVAFGVAAESFGVGRRHAALAAGQAHATALAMAALRLGLIGHRETQRVIRASASLVQGAVEIADGIDWLDFRPSTPQLDVSLARHEVAPARSFAS